MNAKILLTIMLSAVSCGELKPESGRVELSDPEPIILTKAESSMTLSSNDLGFRIFSEIGKAEPLKNRFISPLSLSLALALTAQGADGETLDQMLSVLGFEGYTASEMGGYFKKMTEVLEKTDSTVKLSIANAIWADRVIDVEKGFISDAGKYFDSEVHTGDFSKPSTLSDINSWCSKNTSGRIPVILDELPGGLLMVLLNALYFKGIWENEFPNAKSGTFTSISGAPVKTMLMSQSEDYLYAEDNLFQMVELPYGNGSFVMDVLLPVDPLGFAEAASALDGRYWEKLAGSLGFANVNVTMPVFKTEYTVELSNALKTLGMKAAFGSGADFSKMSRTSLCIDFVKQKTFVEISEKGTEAAAVTAVGMKLTSAGPSVRKVFRADRPFIYLIREVSTGAVLFLGQKTE